jgi:hypothetical protein
MKSTLTVTDLHHGDDCGPLVVEHPCATTLVHCDRDSYTFGETWSPFFASLTHGWLIQDAHDPNDLDWSHNEFAQLQLQGPATIYCLIPVSTNGVVSAGHDHGFAEVQSALGAPFTQQDWQDTGQTYTESNGIQRRVYQMTATTSTKLYHTTHMGHGLVYIVDYQPPSASAYAQSTQGISLFGQNFGVNQQGGLTAGSLGQTGGQVTAMEMHGVTHDCQVTVVANPTATSLIHCDRTYTFGKGWTKFFVTHHNLWLVQVHPQPALGSH